MLCAQLALPEAQPAMVCMHIGLRIGWVPPVVRKASCPAAAVYGTYVVASFTPRVCFEAHHSVAAIKIVVGCSWAIVLLNW